MEGQLEKQIAGNSNTIVSESGWSILHTIVLGCIVGMIVSFFVGLPISPIKIYYHYIYTICFFTIGTIASLVGDLLYDNSNTEFDAEGYFYILTTIGIFVSFVIFILFVMLNENAGLEHNKTKQNVKVWLPTHYSDGNYYEDSVIGDNDMKISFRKFKRLSDKKLLKNIAVSTGTADEGLRVVYSANIKGKSPLEKIFEEKYKVKAFDAREFYIPSKHGQDSNTKLQGNKGVVQVSYYKKAKTLPGLPLVPAKRN